MSLQYKLRLNPAGFSCSLYGSVLFIEDVQITEWVWLSGNGCVCSTNRYQGNVFSSKMAACEKFANSRPKRNKANPNETKITDDKELELHALLQASLVCFGIRTCSDRDPV